MQPIVIIDGNNLAQIKYNLQGKPVTIQYDRQLIKDLSAWALRQKEVCHVDLFFDPRMLLPEGNSRVSVHVVDRGEKADAHIKAFVRHCVLTSKPCLLITDDRELAQDATRQGVIWIEVSEFIKLPNFLNLIPADFEKGSYSYLQQGNHQTGISAPEASQAIRLLPNIPEHLTSKDNRLAAAGLLDAHQRTYQAWRDSSDKDLLAGSTDQGPVSSSPPPGKKRVRLNLETWPLEDGYQFFSEIICDRHRREYQSLLGRPKEASSADLFSYYQFVLELCSAEPDFYTRATSLMNQVRLELLQVFPNGLELAGLEEKYEDHPGFQHKIKLHSGKSIELYESIIPESGRQV